MTLLPNELWDYGPAEMVRGLWTALSARRDGALRTISIPGLGSCLAIRSARAAIVLALKALGLSPGARVGVPLYCCPVVFKAVKAAGCSLRFLDVDPDTFCLSVSDLRAKSSSVDAVIAVHMFGNVCEMARLRELLLDDKPVLEDCAQALGSYLDGRPVGSFGDVGVFSFHSGKYVSAGEGGALYSRDAALERRLSRLIAALPAPSRPEECVHVVKMCLRSSLRRRPLWGLVGASLWEAYSRAVDHTSQTPVVVTRVYETDRRTTIRRLPLLGKWIEKQRAHARYYSRNLALEAGMLCRERPGAFYNRLQYPLLVPSSEQCEHLVHQLRTYGIGAGRPYKDIAGVAAAHYGYSGDCPRAERIAETVMVIPCHHALGPDEPARVARCVNRAWAQLQPRTVRGRSFTPVSGTAAHEAGHPGLQDW